MRSALTLVLMGCLLAGAGANRHGFVIPQPGCTPAKFSSKFRTSPRVRIDAGTLLPMGCLLADAGANRHGL